MIYDIIVAESLATKHARLIELSRFESATPVSNIISVLDKLSQVLTQTFSNEKLIIPDQVLHCVKRLESLNKELQSTPDKSSNIQLEVKELLEVMSYYKYEVYFIERADLTSMPVDDEVYSAIAYLMDKNSLMADHDRFCLGWAISYPSPQSANIPDVTKNFLDTVIKFSPTTEDLIELNVEKEKISALQSTNSGYLYDIKPILSFIENYGYKIIVLLV